MTVGELRKLIADKNDSENIPLYVKYADVCSKYVFLRIDKLAVGKPGKGFLLADTTDPPGLLLTCSFLSQSR